jgi:hypothetical protein
MIAHVRHLTRDLDSAVSDADITTLINDAGHHFYALSGTRTQRLSSTQIADTTFSIPVSATYPRVLAVLRAPASGSFSGYPMTRVSVEKLYWMRREYGVEVGTPTHWAMYRIAGSTARIQMLVYPVSNGSTDLYLVVENEWPDLSGVQTPPVNPEAAYVVARLAAIQCAHVLGRDDKFIKGISDLLPLEFKSLLGIKERKLAPREPKEHAA